MAANAQKTPKTSRMFPAFHKDVAAAVTPHIPLIRFHDSGSDESNKSWTTFVLGLFICYNPKCKTHSWTSGKITILIRGYPGNEYNAEVFGQRCKRCNRLGKLVMDKQSYVERVSNRLMIWEGVQLKRPVYTKKGTPPHETLLCEGCKRGICPQSSS